MELISEVMNSDSYLNLHLDDQMLGWFRCWPVYYEINDLYL